MNKKEIECIARLTSLNGATDDILQHLMEENLIDKTQVKAIRLSSEPHKDMYIMLKALQLNNKLQLLEYEWHVLPIERIKLTIVTDKTQKEFTYNF